MHQAPRTLLVASLILGAIARPAVAQGPETGGGQRRVTVTRNLRESVAPDRATIVLGVEAVTAEPTGAVAQLATLERAVVDTLRRLGIPSSAISVIPYGVSIVRQPGGWQPGMPQHTAQSVIRVAVDRIDRVTAIGNAALAKGSVHVNQPMYEYSQEDSLRRVLVQRAIVEARRDAEGIARSMGGRLGQVVDVTQSTGSGPAFVAGEMVGFPSNVQFMGYGPGRQQSPATVTATVTVRWAFVEGG